MSMDAPKILSVRVELPRTLLVEFVGKQWRRYDITPLLDLPAFEPLRNEALFASVHADRGGYGVIWNDDIDLAEYELWTKGVPVAAPDSASEMLWAAESNKE